MSGENDILYAKSTSFAYLLDTARGYSFPDEWYAEWERRLEAAVIKFNAESKGLNIAIFTLSGVTRSFEQDLNSDLILIQSSVNLVAGYTILFLGSCSPLHFRSCVAFFGLITILVSFICGNALAGLSGYETAGVHNLLSFLLIGIGADDMFVICNALDQTDFTQTIETRFKKAYSVAGPSITITSFTNAISFFVGSTTSLIALGSFCMYAAFSICMLFSTCLTLFSCILVWDTKRVHRRHGDCCRLCCCKENSFICCRGKFLNTKQQKFSQIAPEEVFDDIATPVKKDGLDTGIEMSSTKKEGSNSPASSGSAGSNGSLNSGAKKPRLPVVVYSSGTERFLAERVAPEILSNEGRISIIGVYLVMGVISLFGCMGLYVDFKVEFFIGPTSYVYNWFSLNNEYFRTGDQITHFVDAAETDYASKEIQLQISEFNTGLAKCDNCQESWIE